MDITHSRILKIAVPIVLANSTVPLLGAVDTFVVGQMGSPVPIGAVGIGALIISFFYWLFGFLRMGTTGLAAQAVGAGDQSEVAAILTRVLFLGLLAGLAILIFQNAIFTGALWISPASPEVEALARDYLFIRAFSAPAAIALFGLNGWLIAQERTREVLVLQLVMNGLNMILDVAFVLGLGWGVEGVAIATAIAEFTGLALGLYISRATLRSAAAKQWARVFQRDKLIHMFSVNRDILLRTLMLEVIFVSFTFLAADMGDVQLAANQVLMQFVVISAYMLDGFAFAVEVLVGQAFGARNRAALIKSVKLCALWGSSTSFIFGMLILFAGPSLIDLFTTAPEVQSEARNYIVFVVLAPILGFAAYLFDGIYVGATDTATMRNMMAISLVIYGICLALFLPTLGQYGLWLSLMVSFLARGGTLWLRFPHLVKRLE